MLSPERLQEIKKWNKEGRPSTYQDPQSFFEHEKYFKTIRYIHYKKDIKTILEIGCYTGFLLRYLVNMKYTVTGVDLMNELMDSLNKTYQEHNLDGKFLFASAEKLPFENSSFDCVIMLDVLEHTLNDKKALAEAERVCKKHMIINLPRNDQYHDDSEEHVRIYNDRKIKQMFGKKPSFKMENCLDEFDRNTTFITYELT